MRFILGWDWGLRSLRYCQLIDMIISMLGKVLSTWKLWKGPYDPFSVDG